MRTTYLVALLTIAAGALLAQPADPPSRVARLSYLDGPVSFRPGSVEDWGAASLNFPLTTGDHLWTDNNARAELHIGSTAIRLESQTALAILNLDDRVVQLSLTGGSMNIRLRSVRPDEVYEVDTPNAAILLKAGDYRINADGETNITTVATREGEADINGGGNGFPVYPRQMAHITGTDSPTQDISPMLPPDGFDGWCTERERRELSNVSARYVPRDMIGYEDLDAYGVWRNVAPYGWVWTPTSVAGGWSPYHNGRWAWVEPWGWTWIDEAPWGFAPFHYGRWAFAGGAWVWAPGRLDIGVRPVYAPALVAFVGGPRFGVAVGVGGGGGMAAWFPLGPGEVYRPAYHVSEVYVRQINVVHVTDVTVINRGGEVRYVNQGVPGAVVAVPHEAFVGARPVGAVAVRVDAREVAGAPVMGSTAGFAPRRESVLAAEGRGSAPPARFAERQVVTRSTPPPPPVSFSAKQQALESNGGRPLDPNTVNNLRRNSDSRPPATRINNAAPVRNDRPPVRTDEVRPTPPNGATTPVRRDEVRPVTPPSGMTTPVRRDNPPTRTEEVHTATPPSNTAPPAHVEPTPNRNVEERKGEERNNRGNNKKSTKK